MRSRDILEQAFEQYVFSRNFKKFPIKVGGVCGVATNDADYITQIQESLPNGKQKMVWKCPVYTAWKSVIERSYSQNFKEKNHTYQNVMVCDEWHLFSNFRSWWMCNNVAGWQLEKDLLIKGNLIYSPDRCVYVPNYINTLLIDHAAKRGECPLGVCFHKHRNRFQSVVSLNGKLKHLGHFHTPEEAHRAWQIGKIQAIKDAIARYTEESTNLGVLDQRTVTALEGRIAILRDDVDNGRETFVLH